MRRHVLEWLNLVEIGFDFKNSGGGRPHGMTSIAEFSVQHSSSGDGLTVVRSAPAAILRKLGRSGSGFYVRAVFRRRVGSFTKQMSRTQVTSAAKATPNTCSMP